MFPCRFFKWLFNCFFCFDVDEQSPLDKVENIINAINDLKTFLPTKEEKDEVQIETTTKSSLLCPLDYPFAYWNGGYCCQTNKERPVELGITPQNEIEDGTCDGVDFNRQSYCCNSEHAPCPHESGCFDNSVDK